MYWSLVIRVDQLHNGFTVYQVVWYKKTQDINLTLIPVLECNQGVL